MGERDLHSGAPVEGLTSNLIALLHHGLLSEPERRALLDTLAKHTLRAPWGTRSTTSDDPLYDPDSYATTKVRTATYGARRRVLELRKSYVVSAAPWCCDVVRARDDAGVMGTLISIPIRAVSLGTPHNHRAVSVGSSAGVG